MSRMCIRFVFSKFCFRKGKLLKNSKLEVANLTTVFLHCHFLGVYVHMFACNKHHISSPNKENDFKLFSMQTIFPNACKDRVPYFHQ